MFRRQDKVKRNIAEATGVYALRMKRPNQEAWGRCLGHVRKQAPMKHFEERASWQLG
jgi:hypothetical protein